MPSAVYQAHPQQRASVVTTVLMFMQLYRARGSSVMVGCLGGCRASLQLLMQMKHSQEAQLMSRMLCQMLSD